MRATLLSFAFAAGVLLLAGCQDPDVGQRCSLPSALVANDQAVSADFFESGNTACESLFCIKSPPPPAGCGAYANGPGSCRAYCSKPCVSNDDCAQSETGLVCRPVVLDATFINFLSLTEEGRAILEQWLGDNRQPNYCALPLP